MIYLFRCATTECADILNHDAEKTINLDALERNLASFGLERNEVPSDGNCCFSSIVSQLYKIKDNKSISKEYTEFITELGKYRYILKMYSSNFTLFSYFHSIRALRNCVRIPNKMPLLEMLNLDKIFQHDFDQFQNNRFRFVQKY